MKNKFQGLIIVIYALIIEDYTMVSTTRPLFHFGVADFSTVVETVAYIDKSLLMKEFLRYKFLLVTTPRYFGKSTNIDMMKRFFEIEVDCEGNPKSKGLVLRKRVDDTKNYELFVANNLEITEHSNVMSEHFGKHPVVHADLKCTEVITSYDGAVKFLKHAVHRSFVQHGYLTKSDELSDSEKLTCEMWCSERNYTNYTVHDVIVGLMTLSKYLYKHFGKRKCVVLIDEYDNLIIRSTIKVFDKAELRRIIRLNVGIVSAVVRNNARYVDRGVITGVSYVAGVYLSGVSNVAVCRFLESHRFVDYFGVTLAEIDRLFEKPELNRTSVAYSSLSGYVSKWGKRIYSFHSVLQILHTQSLKVNFR